MIGRGVRTVQATYERVRTQVRDSVGVTDTIPVRIGLHQGNSLSPYLFGLVMDVLTFGIKGQPPGACFLLMTFYCVGPER